MSTAADTLPTWYPTRETCDHAERICNCRWKNEEIMKQRELTDKETDFLNGLFSDDGVGLAGILEALADECDEEAIAVSASNDPRDERIGKRWNRAGEYLRTVAASDTLSVAR